jgi:pimeloyl-ACP methyl ester carboxylesterase
MSTSFATTADGTRIAYDAVGEGLPLVLLHGGWVEDRRAWHDYGYVERLGSRFRLLVIDARGHGESDRPTTVEAYAAGRICEDVLAVLNAERVHRASVWGWSYGGSIALQLATTAPYVDHVDRVVLGGVVLGRWLTREIVDPMLRTLQDLADAKAKGAIDDLPMHDVKKDFGRRADIAVATAACQAMLDWPVVEPESLRRPAMFYTGSAYLYAMDLLTPYKERLAKAGASWIVLDGLDHRGEFEAIDRALPECVSFLTRGDA